MWPFFNPTIEVVTVCLHEECMLSVFKTWMSGSFVSVRWNACVQTRPQLILSSERGKSLVWLNCRKQVCLFVVCCLTSQQHASVSQGRICSDKFTCCHTETEVTDQTFYLTQSQYTNSGPTVSALTLYCQAPGRVATGVPVFSHWYDSTQKNPVARGIRNPRSHALEADALTTRPTRRSEKEAKSPDLSLARKMPYH